MIRKPKHYGSTKFCLQRHSRENPPKSVSELNDLPEGDLLAMRESCNDVDAWLTSYISREAVR